MTDRLTLSLGTRYTLNFPSTEVNNHGAVFNLGTQVLDFPHTARNLECCDFGPRAGLAYSIGDSLVIRSGYGMIWFEQTGITTPFTLPQFPFVQTVGQQSQDNINPAFVLSEWSDGAGLGAKSEFGTRPRGFRRRPERRVGLFTAVESHFAENFPARSEFRDRLPGIEEYALWACRNPTSINCPPPIWL